MSNGYNSGLVQFVHFNVVKLENSSFDSNGQDGHSMSTVSIIGKNGK